jgi:hypothetical protein
MRSPGLSILALVLATTSACGKSDSKPAPGAEATAPPASGAEVIARRVAPPPGANDAKPAADLSKGSCELSIEGDVQTKVVAPANAQPVGTDYWMTPEQIDQAVEMMVNMMVKDKAKAAAEIAKAKLNEPRIMLLIVNCDGDKVHLTFSPGIGSKYKDVPYGPGKYPIAATPRNNEFGVMFSVERKFFKPTEGGSIEITRFDNTGLTASFEFPAENVDKLSKAITKVTVKGKLDYPCPPTNLACKH